MIASRYLFFLIVIFITTTHSLFAFKKYDWKWAKNTIAQDGFSNISDVCTDRHGNTYIIGSFSSTAFKLGGLNITNMDTSKNDFGICVGGCQLTSYSDIFYAKIDSSGQPQWLRSIEGMGNQNAYSIAVDENDNIVILGSSYTDSVYIDNTLYTLTKQVSYNNNNFILSTSSTGQVNWFKQINGKQSSFYSIHKTVVTNTSIYFILNLPTEEDKSIDIMDTLIKTDFMYNATLLFCLDKKTGSKKFIKPVFSASTPTDSDPGFNEVHFLNGLFYTLTSSYNKQVKIGTKSLTFQGGEYSMFYIVSVIDTLGNCIQLFAHTSESYNARLAVNATTIAIAETNNTYPDYDPLLTLNYYSHSGKNNIKKTIQNSTSNYQNFNIDAIVIDDNDRLFLAASASDTFYLANSSYVIPRNYDALHQLQNAYSDMFMLLFNSDGSLEYTEHIQGLSLSDRILFLQQHNNNIYVIGDYQSGVIKVGETELVNNNMKGYTTFHNEPNGVFAYNNFLIAKMGTEIIAQINTPSQNENMLIYPNPSNSLFTIQVDDTGGILYIIDTQGKLVLEEVVTQQKNTYSINAGLYFVVYKNKQTISSHKVSIY